MKKVLFAVGVITIIGLGVFLLLSSAQKTSVASKKISVVTTLFPQYDFAKVIGGEKVDVTLLLPPGVEPHAYEPKPSDIAKINSAKIFIYTGEIMEPWAHDIIESADKKIKIVDASVGVEMIKEDEYEQEDEVTHHHHDGADPHIWLDFGNAKKMAENVAKALIEVDSQNARYYKSNLENYQVKLDKLDEAYKKALLTCSSKTIIYSGHYAFGYLAKRYGLEYKSAQGFSPDAEPTAKDMIALVDQISQENIKYIFYEELTSAKIAETLANETNVKLLLLNGAHNLTKEDYEAGMSFISLMEENLKNLQMGLGCK